MKVYFLIFLSWLSLVIGKKEIDIKEDFNVDVEYRLEKSSTTWKKRGVINFLQKNSNKNYKASANVLNEAMTNEQIEEIKSECKNGNGLYYVRVRTQSNVFFSQVNSCDLLRSKFYDRFIINHFGPVRNDQIISVSYDIDTKTLIETQNESSNKGFNTKVEFVENVQSVGPTFPEEKDVKQQQQPEQQSFLSKYWWMIMIVVFLMLPKGQTPDESQASA